MVGAPLLGDDRFGLAQRRDGIGLPLTPHERRGVVVEGQAESHAGPVPRAVDPQVDVRIECRTGRKGLVAEGQLVLESDA